MSEVYPHCGSEDVVNHNPHFLGPLWIAQTDHPRRLVILVKWALHNYLAHLNFPSPEGGEEPPPG